MFNPQLEKKLRQRILPELEKGRKDFDRPHTEAVVHWMKYLLKKLPEAATFDETVLITAAYAHDWGYIGLFDSVPKTDLATIHKMKPLHMERGAELINDFINAELRDYITPAQQKRIRELVTIHDRVEEVKRPDEILLMEADTMGMLDSDRVKPTFSAEDNDIFLEREVLNRRLPLFRHPLAREIADSLVAKRRAFYQQAPTTT